MHNFGLFWKEFGLPRIYHLVKYIVGNVFIIAALQQPLPVNCYHGCRASRIWLRNAIISQSINGAEVKVVFQYQSRYYRNFHYKD